MRQFARSTEDELERNIARNRRKKSIKYFVSDGSQRKYRPKSQVALLFSVVSNLVHEDGERYFRGFEQYIGSAVNITEFVVWLENLKTVNTPLSYKNIAALREVQIRAILGDQNSDSPAQLPGASRIASQQCICEAGDGQILEWIQNQSIPGNALYNACCWVRVCQVRGRNLLEVEEKTWEEICRTRGHLKY